MQSRDELVQAAVRMLYDNGLSAAVDLVLEEAAKIAQSFGPGDGSATIDEIAKTIRALKGASHEQG